MVGHGISQSILTHAEEHGHWQFVGHGGGPWFLPEEIPWKTLDGVIGEFADDRAAKQARRHGVAVVNLSTVVQGLPYALVGTDDEVAGRMGAEHLMRRGFPAYAFFGLAPFWESRQRLHGFKATLEQAGRVCHVREDDSFDNAQPQKTLRQWLSELPKPIAIMAYNDWWAAETITAALHLGLRIPDDVAVLGMNDNCTINILSKVPISSIQLDKSRVGLLAAELLDRLMDGEPVPPPIIVPPLGIKTRKSTDVIATDDPVVAQAMRYIQEKATTGINVVDVLKVVDVSRKTLNKRMNRAINVTPHVLITEIRVDAVKRMLSTTNLAVEEVSRLCGYSKQQRLNEAFKRVTGLTPTEFRQQHPTA